MFSHVMLGANDLERSKVFYDALFAVLGVRAGRIWDRRVMWNSPTGTFLVSLPINGQPATVGNGSTLGFLCSSPEQVDAWHAAGVAHGGTTCEDPPGIRHAPKGSAYVAYLRDPDGNKLCGYHQASRS